MTSYCVSRVAYASASSLPSMRSTMKSVCSTSSWMTAVASRRAENCVSDMAAPHCGPVHRFYRRE